MKATRAGLAAPAAGCAVPPPAAAVCPSLTGGVPLLLPPLLLGAKLTGVKEKPRPASRDSGAFAFVLLGAAVIQSQDDMGRTNGLWSY